MIKKIELLNFQGHKDSGIEFSDGFNLILGSSNHGKSSIIRAIEWVRKNRPRGTDFINYDSDSMEVKIFTGESTFVSRKRGSKDSGQYEVSIDGSSEVFSFSGNDVPEAVTELLGLSDLNVQSQLDLHYLILDTPGRAAGEVNTLTKLDKLTGALDKLKEKKTKIHREISDVQDDIEGLHKILDSDVENMISELRDVHTDIAKLEARIESDQDTIIEVRSVISELEYSKKNIGRFSGLVELDKILFELMELSATDSEERATFDAIQGIVSNYEDVWDGIKQCERDLDDYSNQIMDIKRNMKECPYCGNGLDKNSRAKLLGG